MLEYKGLNSKNQESGYEGDEAYGGGENENNEALIRMVSALCTVQYSQACQQIRLGAN